MAYSKNRQRFSMSFSKENYDRLKTYCDCSGVSMAEFVEDSTMIRLDSDSFPSRAELVQNVKELRDVLINMHKILKRSKDERF